MAVTSLIFHYSLRPLYNLLRWLDNYTPGKGVKDLPQTKSSIEFRKLTQSARNTIERTEAYLEQQKQFIGNASHELQTPLAILGTRIEWLIDNTQLTEEQFAELTKMRQSLHRLTRLNRTLLLISKIENAQFNSKEDVELTELIINELEVYEEIYADKGITCTKSMPQSFVVRMDGSLATTMVTNLLKNAFLHTEDDGEIKISISGNRLVIANSGKEALNAGEIFNRFYTSGKSGSTGLGLALVKSIAGFYKFKVEYKFSDNMHYFGIQF